MVIDSAVYEWYHFLRINNMIFAGVTACAKPAGSDRSIWYAPYIVGGRFCAAV